MHRSRPLTRPTLLLLLLFFLLTLASACAKKIVPSAPPARAASVVIQPEPAPIPEPSPSTPPAPSEPSKEPNRPNYPVRPKTFQQYTVLGQTYQPLETGQHYVEEGIASWYGTDFHGKATACGENYNMHDLTAAHRILPMHTHVRVTNLDNGQSVTVRVNDRGPFVKNRIIDLSFAAADALKIVGPGTGRVRVESIETWNKEIPGRFFVQVGSFRLKENAKILHDRLIALGYGDARIVQADVNGEVFLRVQAGVFTTLSSAQKAVDDLTRDYPGGFILAD